MTSQADIEGMRLKALRSQAFCSLCGGAITYDPARFVFIHMDRGHLHAPVIGDATVEAVEPEARRGPKRNDNAAVDAIESQLHQEETT